MDAQYTEDQSYLDFSWRFIATSFTLVRFSECLNPIFYNLSSRYELLLE